MSNATTLPKLDARPDRIDLRDRSYLPPLKALLPEFPPAEYISEYFPLYRNLILDQGSEGACTGFGLACTINYLQWSQVVLQNAKLKRITESDLPAQVSYRMLYHLARFYDEWPGEDYEGSSCRGAVKAWYKHGVCELQKWPYRDANGKVVFIKPERGWENDAAQRPLGVYYRITKESITDMRAAIMEVGAIYVSAKVHEGWQQLPRDSQHTPHHDSLPRIKWDNSSKIIGGHAFALVGYNRHGFILQNSWGESWGNLGFAILSYEDWIENGSDAWVCVMGAQTEKAVKTHFVSTDSDRDEFIQSTDRMNLAFLKKPSDHTYQDPEVQPWDEEQAYKHTVVMGNDGKVINRLLANDGASDTVDDIVLRRGGKWLVNQSSAPKRLVVYAHGGLNSECASINRIKTMAPYFKANGIYPLFLTWQTGVRETITSIMEDSVNRLFPTNKGFEELVEKAKERATEVLDRTLEVACEKLGVKAIWSQMKQNAAESALKADGDRGTYLLLKALVRLKADIPDLEVHIIGHSAGSIILGHFLDDCTRNNLTIDSCTLYAPACSIEFANSRYGRAHDNGTLTKDKLTMHILSEKMERDDTVGPYRKSLLYLVSRALEGAHKTPLLGMEKSFNETSLVDNTWNSRLIKEVENWQKFWANGKMEILGKEQVCTSAVWEGNAIAEKISHINAAHGSFDNDVEVVEKTIMSILGEPLKHHVENLQY
jgi:hypothetical protein